ncbi:MAG: hypothetical protein KF708_15055 [Pirellulales bacterium]|nr:hypothetical protein [Pirellulales bacterium]
MGIDVAHYHGWRGKLLSPWWACIAIVRVALLQVFRRKSYWIVLALGLLNFLLYWSVIYAIAQFDIPVEAQDRLMEVIGFRTRGGDSQENGYIEFMQRQSIVVMLLLAFSGSLLVGADFRFQSLPFYLSRRIDRRHYIVGKLLAVSVIVSMMTTLPALLLFIEFGTFTASTDYWRENWRIPLAVLAFGAIMCTVLSILLVTISAYLQSVAPIAITWSSLFVLLGSMSRYLRAASPYWELINPWRDIRLVGKMCFGTFRDDTEYSMALWALLILVSVCTLALVALARRVRAIEIVT